MFVNGCALTASLKRPREPVKLGYKTFKDGDEACAYFRNLMTSVPTNHNMNEVSNMGVMRMICVTQSGNVSSALNMPEFDLADILCLSKNKATLTNLAVNMR